VSNTSTAGWVTTRTAGWVGTRTAGLGCLLTFSVVTVVFGVSAISDSDAFVSDTFDFDTFDSDTFDSDTFVSDTFVSDTSVRTTAVETVSDPNGDFGIFIGELFVVYGVMLIRYNRICLYVVDDVAGDPNWAVNYFSNPP
jgi:hypothetical protein